MIAFVPAALSGTLRYEFLMAVRSRFLWAASAPLVILASLFAATAPGRAEASSASIIASWALTLSLVATLGPGVVLADRFARLSRLGLGELLATSPVNMTARMAAALCASLTAALAPASLVLLGVGIVVAISRRDIGALGWALTAIVLVVVPAALVLVSFAVAAASLVPVIFARIGVVIVWLWATIWNTALIPIPTVTGTLLSPLGDYVTTAWMNGPRLWAGQGWAPLAPEPTTPAAWINVAALVALSAVFFTIARLGSSWRQ